MKYLIEYGIKLTQEQIQEINNIYNIYLDLINDIVEYDSTNRYGTKKEINNYRIELFVQLKYGNKSQIRINGHYFINNNSIQLEIILKLSKEVISKSIKYNKLLKLIKRILNKFFKENEDYIKYIIIHEYAHIIDPQLQDNPDWTKDYEIYKKSKSELNADFTACGLIIIDKLNSDPPYEWEQIEKLGNKYCPHFDIISNNEEFKKDFLQYINELHT